MSDVELLLLAIQREPDDCTAVACLTDALMTERDMTRSEADRFAERAVQSVKDARDIAAAAALLAKGTPWHAELVRDILEWCGLTADTNAQIVISPGTAAPSYHDLYPETAGPFWFETTVTVGALWVTAHWRRNPSLSLMPSHEKPKRRRSR